MNREKKYHEAYKKYACLMKIAVETTSFKELLKKLNEIEEVDDKTTVEVIIKKEYNKRDTEQFSSSKHCFYAGYDKLENKVIIQNFV